MNARRLSKFLSIAARSTVPNFDILAPYIAVSGDIQISLGEAKKTSMISVVRREIRAFLSVRSEVKKTSNAMENQEIQTTGEWLTLSQAAAVANVSKATVIRWAHSGVLPQTAMLPVGRTRVRYARSRDHQ
jgi:excisionase family DNA binding protein